MDKEKQEPIIKANIIKGGAEYFIQNLEYARDAVETLENDAKESWEETGVGIDFERFTVIKENVLSFLNPTQWVFDSDRNLKSAPNLVYQAEDGNYIYLISAEIHPGDCTQTAVACVRVYHECGKEQDVFQQYDFDNRVWITAECDVCDCSTEHSGYAS